QRVRVEEVTEVLPIDFERTTTTDPAKFTDQRKVTVRGVPGERTLVHSVVTVDGAEESRELLSDTVTVEPVTEVTVVGTKKRPVVTVDVGRDASGLNWGALAACESGGNPSIV